MGDATRSAAGAVGGTAIAITVDLDLDHGSIAASVAAPLPLDELLQSLPSEAAAIQGWLPDITLDTVGLSFTGDSDTFGVYAAAGTSGSTTPAANLFIGSVPVSGSVQYVAGVAVDAEIDLSGLPLFGSMLTGLSVSDLAIAYASGDIPAGALLLPPPAAVQQPPFAQGLSLGFTISAAGGSQSFSLQPSGGSNALDASLAQGGSGLPPIQWFPVQQTFGPLTLNRVGAVTAPGIFGLALDAALATAVLSITLDGFTVTLPTNDVSIGNVSIALQGLSVEVQTGAVSISGGLVQNTTAGGIEYDGSVLMQIGSYGITAVGSFTSVNGAPSLFVFGLASGELGGPPAFFVTGIAAGFGYNRSLTLPSPAQVSQFPLVLAAQNPESIGGGGVAAALSALSQGGWVPPELGASWVAAGVQFTSFQVVQSFALLTVELGSELVIALLGTSTIQLPTPQDSTETYAYAELMLDAVLKPADGTFAATGLLTPNSYVLDPNCRLTGGFAVDVWFGSSKHAGDFVATLGGYNANFTPPPWYPSAPRLGFDWKVSSEIEVTGQAYFAVTPSCAMAGGSLAVTYTAGALSAWFTAWADFIVFWRPFYFIADVGVSIGASYDLNLGFTHQTFTVALGAEVSLWGPPVAGVATVNWWVISFTVNINGGGQPSPPPNVLGDWGTFATTFLPPPPSNDAPQSSQQPQTVCGVRAVSGLLSQKNGTWTIAADRFAFTTSTTIPATTAVVGTSTSIPGYTVGIYPMAKKATTTHTVTMTNLTNGSTPVDLSSWNPAGVASQAPAALWGTGNDGHATLGANAVPALLGVAATAPPATSSGPPSLPFHVLQDDLRSRAMDLPAGPPADRASAPTSLNPLTVVEATVASLPVISTRDAIVAALNARGVGHGLTGGDLSLLARDAGIALSSPPMLGALGTTGPKAGGQAATPLPAGEPEGEAAAPQALTYRGLMRRWTAGSRDRARAHLLDRFATASDRQVAYSVLVPRPGARAAMSVPAQTTLLWEVAPGVRLALAADGRLPLRVSMFGEDGFVAGDVVLDAGRQHALDLPPDLARIALTALSDGKGDSSDGVFGWRGTSALLQISPRAFLGDDAIIRIEAPFRISQPRRSRDCGVTIAREAVRHNHTQRQSGIVPGYVETHLPAATRALFVPLIADPRVSERAASHRAIGVRAMRGSREVAIVPGRTSAEGVASYLVPAGSKPLRVIVRTSPGWLQDGLIGMASEEQPAQVPPLRPARPSGSSRRETTVVIR